MRQENDFPALSGFFSPTFHDSLPHDLLAECFDWRYPDILRLAYSTDVLSSVLRLPGCGGEHHAVGRREALIMSIRILRGDTDPVIEQIIQALKIYEDDHPNSEIALYRQNPVSVRIRIIDPNFARHNKIQRNRSVWNYLGKLAEDTQSDISTLILLTPSEIESSFANFEFNDPVPSSL
jgi:hypothetical protein